AHRLSTIHKADLILVMDRGEIVERGTHQDLVRRDGLYRQLHEAQMGIESLPPVSVTAGSETASLPATLGTGNKIVVLGSMSKMPVAGIVFITMQYLVGLTRLGYDVFYV